MASGVGGCRNFTTSGGFGGFSRRDLNTTHKLPTSSLASIKGTPGPSALVHVRWRKRDGVRENTADSCLKLNFGQERVTKRWGLGSVLLTEPGSN